MRFYTLSNYQLINKRNVVPGGTIGRFNSYKPFLFIHTLRIIHMTKITTLIFILFLFLPYPTFSWTTDHRAQRKAVLLLSVLKRKLLAVFKMISPDD